MPKFEEKDLDGALWKKEGPKGVFFSGYILVNGVKCDIVAFKNDVEENPKRPILSIRAGKPRQEKQEETPLTKEDIPF